MKYFFIVGEASGDVHTSKLLAEMIKIDPSAEIVFWGGDRMAAAVGQDKMLNHYKDGAFMGVWEVARNIKKVFGRIKKCKKDIIEFNPDVVVLVDFAGFNMKIAKFAKKRGIKTFYYIAPKVWAWRESRAKKIAKYVDELFCIFPFEIEFFKKWGINAHYFGNPLIEEINQKQENIPNRETFIRDNELEDKPIIAILAGSRNQEIEYNLPFMSKVASRLTDYQFVVAAVGWLDKSLYSDIISAKANNIKIVYDKTYETLLNSEAAIVTSGTATLETALLGVPEVVCYKCSALTYYLGRLLIKIKFISLVNIVMDKTVVRELLNDEMHVKTVEVELRKILPGGDNHLNLMNDYETLRSKMGGGNTSKLVAEKMIELLKQ